jgi:hypothetical protein
MMVGTAGSAWRTRSRLIYPMSVGNRPWLLRGVVLALALVVGVVAWLATRDDGSSAPALKAEAEPRTVVTHELGSIAAVSGHPVYWAGPIPGTSLEATESADGSVQVRYLEEGAAAGEQPAAFLTVGTYPLPDPAGALKAFTKQPGSIIHSRDGRKVATNAEKPTSVYFVNPDNTVQVEVYDPSPRRALSLALSGQVRPAG